ncbi:hypothetical protein NX059_010722 [Plenodomus lindquistii]|nr:hypothetical protein NX059_010722 [Plenodomus lindquistii]
MQSPLHLPTVNLTVTDADPSNRAFTPKDSAGQNLRQHHPTHPTDHLPLISSTSTAPAYPRCTASEMRDDAVGKRPLKPPSKAMTSSSSTQSAKVAAGDMVFSVAARKSKVTTFNPVLTPSPLLDPKVRERMQKGKEIAFR